MNIKTLCNNSIDEIYGDVWHYRTSRITIASIDTRYDHATDLNAAIKALDYYYDIEDPIDEDKSRIASLENRMKRTLMNMHNFSIKRLWKKGTLPGISFSVIANIHNRISIRSIRNRGIRYNLFRKE